MQEPARPGGAKNQRTTSPYTQQLTKEEFIRKTIPARTVEKTWRKNNPGTQLTIVYLKISDLRQDQ